MQKEEQLLLLAQAALGYFTVIRLLIVLPRDKLRRILSILEVVAEPTIHIWVTAAAARPLCDVSSTTMMECICLAWYRYTYAGAQGEHYWVYLCS